jgi:hypothetical protein
MRVFDLPISVFSHIRDFVVLPSVDDDENERAQMFKEWRGFCNMSRHHVCSEMKKKYSFYNLNASNSLNYISYHLDRELGEEANVIICRVLGSMSNPKYQVFLDFGNNYRLLDFPAEEDFYAVINTEVYGINVVGMDRHRFSLDMIDLSFLSTRGACYCIFALPSSVTQLLTIQKLNITCGKLVTNEMLPIFANLQELSLEESNITNVSPLKNIKKLSLIGSVHLTDISPLRNVYDLNISHCDAIQDITPLGNVHRLNLAHCKNLIDVSALSAVYDLNIDFCKKIKNISSLDHVQILSVRGGKGGKLPPGLSINNTARKLVIPFDSISLYLLSGMKDKNKLITLDNFVTTQPSGMNAIIIGRWYNEVILKDFLKGYERLCFSLVGFPTHVTSLHSLRILHLKFSPYMKLRDLPALEELSINNGAGSRSKVMECIESPLPQLKKLTLRNMSFPMNLLVLDSTMYPLLREFILEEFNNLKVIKIGIPLMKLQLKKNYGKFNPLLVNIVENGSLDIIETSSCDYSVVPE